MRRRLSEHLLRNISWRRNQNYTSARESDGNGERKYTRLTGIAFFSTITCGTACLGVWQTRRYMWKRDLIRERKERLQEDAITLPLDATASGNINDLEYHQLRLEGTYEPGSTFYLYPRSSPAEASDSVANPQSGGYVYSLLTRANGTPLIVNRGWLSQKSLLKHMAVGDREDEDAVTLTGVLRHGEKPGAFTPQNDFANRHMYWLDHDAVANAMGVRDVLPVLVDAIEEENQQEKAPAEKLLRPKLYNYTTFYMTPEKHAGYAITWYSISLAAAIFGYVRFRRLKKK